jgi:putative phosphoesterase
MNDFGKQALVYTKTMIKKEHFNYLSSLNQSEMIDIGTKKVLITHSAPGYPIWKEVPPGTSANDFNEMFEKSGVDIIMLGHTHLPFIRKFKKGLIINPGSVGQPRDGNPNPSYIELTANGDNVDIELKRFTYSIDEVQRSVFMEGLPNFLAERLYMGI